VLIDHSVMDLIGVAMVLGLAAASSVAGWSALYGP
jgi:UPF0716 family protein affecting phage T7 exclusion